MKALQILVIVIGLLTILTSSTCAQTCLNLGAAGAESNTQNFDGLTAVPGPRNADTANLVELNASNPRRWLGILSNTHNDSGADVDLPGWALVEEGSNASSVTGRYNVGDGSNAGPNTYSFGSSSDRALGSLNDNTVSTTWLGGCFTNAHVSTTYHVTVAFTGEQWRRATANDKLTFEVSVVPASSTFPNPNIYSNGETWVAVPDLDFTGPQTGTVGSLNGNASANRTIVAATFVGGVGPGDTIYIRWRDDNLAGDDAGLAIDDVTVDFSVAPSAATAELSGRVLNSRGRGIPNARLLLTSSSGARMQAISNSFGYYSFQNLESGNVYVVTVAAKGHIFAPSTQVITLSDSITDADFVSSP